MRRKTPSYRDAIQWIAQNDDTSCLSEPEAMPSVTMALVADLFARPESKVMSDTAKVIALSLSRASKSAIVKQWAAARGLTIIDIPLAKSEGRK